MLAQTACTMYCRQYDLTLFGNMYIHKLLAQTKQIIDNVAVVQIGRTITSVSVVALANVAL